ncbi:hypothetical protein Tco_0667346 [Tanacetum coccineum]
MDEPMVDPEFDEEEMDDDDGGGHLRLRSWDPDDIMAMVLLTQPQSDYCGGAGADPMTATTWTRSMQKPAVADRGWLRLGPSPGPPVVNFFFLSPYLASLGSFVISLKSNCGCLAGGDEAGGGGASGGGAGGAGAGGARASGAGAGGVGVGGVGPAAPKITRILNLCFESCDCKERDKVKFELLLSKGRALTCRMDRIASIVKVSSIFFVVEEVRGDVTSARPDGIDEARSLLAKQLMGQIIQDID